MVNDWMTRGVLRCGGSLRLRTRSGARTTGHYATATTQVGSRYRLDSLGSGSAGTVLTQGCWPTQLGSIVPSSFMVMRAWRVWSPFWGLFKPATTRLFFAAVAVGPACTQDVFAQSWPPSLDASAGTQFVWVG